MKLRYVQFFICTIIMMTTLALQNLMAQNKATYMRMARITVDSTKLNDYLTALTLQMQSALKNEEGVLAYSAFQDREHPNKITIVETYETTSAYQSHILTDHFRKYKATVANMVKHLELTDVIPIAIQSKQQ